MNDKNNVATHKEFDLASMIPVEGTVVIGTVTLSSGKPGPFIIKGQKKNISIKPA